MIDIQTIKSWFQRGKKPTAAQFAAVFDSFLHKSEKIEIEDVNNLDAELESLRREQDAYHTVKFQYEDGTTISTQKINDGGFIAKLPSVNDDLTRNSWLGFDTANLTNIKEDKEVTRYQFPDKSKYVFGFEDGSMSYSDTEEMEDKEILITLSVPDGVDKVSENAFEKCSQLTDVTLSDDIMSIGDKAFYGCVGLKNCNLPKNLESIGRDAFYAALIGSLDIPESVREIGDCAFGVSKITSVILPEGVTLGSAIFKYCTRLKNVLLPESLTVLPSDTFSDCKLLHNVSLPEGLEEIGERAFYGSGIADVYLRESMIIGAYAFAYADKLGSLSIPEGIGDIGTGAFAYSGIKDVLLPQSIDKISPSMFKGCKLTEVTLPKGLTIIDESAFAGCEDLENVAFEDRVIRETTYIGDHEIEDGPYVIEEASLDVRGCPKDGSEIYSYTVAVGDTLLFEDDTLTISYFDASKNSLQFDIDNSNVCLDSSNDDEQASINGLIIPNDGLLISRVTKALPLHIGSEAFAYCKNIHSISLPPFSPFEYNEITYDSQLDCSVFKESGITNLSVGEGETKLGGHILKNCKKLTEVLLPHSLQRIEEHAFDGCCKLKTIQLQHTQLRTIGPYAFCGLGHDEDGDEEEYEEELSLVFPTTLEYVNMYAFADSIVSELVFNSPVCLDEASLSNMTNLRTLIFNDVDSLPERIFHMPWETLATNLVENIQIPEGWIFTPNGDSSHDNVFFAFPNITASTLSNIVTHLGVLDNPNEYGCVLYVHENLNGMLDDSIIQAIADKGYLIQYVSL